MAKNERIESLNGMRGLMSLMLLLAHTNAMIASNLFHGFFMRGSYVVDFFFTLSGFLLYYNYRESENRLSDGAEYIKKRFVRIYPVYWIYTLITVAVVLFIKRRFGCELIYWNDLSLKSIVRSLLCIVTDVKNGKRPVIPTGWTLPYEVFFYLVSLSLILGGKKVFRNVLLIWAAAIVVFQFYRVDNIYVAFLFDRLFLEFIAGVGLAALVKNGKHVSKAQALLILTAGVVYFLVFWTGNNLGVAYPPYITRVEKFGIPFALIIYGLAEYERQGKIPRFRVLSHFASASYSLYLTHYTVIIVLIFVFDSCCPTLPQIVKFLIALIVSMIVGDLAYVFVEKKVNTIVRKLLKNRWVSIGLAAGMILTYLLVMLILIF